MTAFGGSERGLRSAATQDVSPTVQDYWRRPANLLRRLQRLSVALFAEECGGLDISRTQFEAMIAVFRFPGLDQISLARTFGIDRSTTAQVVKVLVERGLVARSRHAEDGRKRVLELTPQGAEVLSTVTAAALRAEARLLYPLSDVEARALVSALQVIATEVASSAPDWNLDGGPVEELQRHMTFDYISRRLGFLLRRSVQVAFALFGAATADLDITPTQYGLLFLLKVFRGDEATVSRLIGVDRSTSDRLLKRLMARGYVTRGLHRDRDALHLTPAGEAIFQDVQRRTEAVDGGLLEALAPEHRAGFVDTLDKLLFVHR